ncbi:cytochrome P450 94C1 [Ananas comosus]|uniref:Cytochrome P450 94C1 n=2 Tax=Ananas comosus TaxID=4615 RepID=A0A6P5GEZ0_ANACO|nr:cytochrome P450 94C1 [Ananas comosus]
MGSAAADLLSCFRSYFCLIFFGLAAAFVAFALILALLRWRRPWCSCEVCRAYLSSSWAGEFANLCDWFAHLLRASPTGTIHVHVLGNTVTANPANVEYMLKTRFDNFPKGKPFSSVLGDLLGRGIFNVDGDAWIFQRKMASLELGSVSVRSYAFTIVSGEIHRRLLPLLGSVADSGRAVDLQDVFRRFAFDTICKISFGLDPGCLDLTLPASELAAAFDAASSLSARRGSAAVPALWKLKRLLNVGSERELRRAIRTVNALADAVIGQRRKLGPTGHHDLLSRFMQATLDGDDSGGSSSENDRYLRDIVVSFLLAGRDTVASALTTFFLLVSRHPSAAAAVREEIARAAEGAGALGGAASYESLKGMQYVRAALYESMRLYPPVQFDSKFCAEDDVLPDGTFVSAGTRVTYHPYAMGRMEAIWGPDCGEFKPERWLKDGVFAPASLFKYPVFQAGLRVCLGKELAIMEMKSVIVSVLQSFDIDVICPAGAPPKFAPGLTASISGGLAARVRKRQSGAARGRDF